MDFGHICLEGAALDGQMEGENICILKQMLSKIARARSLSARRK